MAQQNPEKNVAQPDAAAAEAEKLAQLDADYAKKRAEILERNAAARTEASDMDLFS